MACRSPPPSTPVAQKAALDLVGEQLREQPAGLARRAGRRRPGRPAGYARTTAATRAAATSTTRRRRTRRRPRSSRSCWPRRCGGHRVPVAVGRQFAADLRRPAAACRCVNHDGLQCPDCTLEQAMVHSLNTPFYARHRADRRRQGPGHGAWPRHPGHVRRAASRMVDAKGDPTAGPDPRRHRHRPLSGHPGRPGHRVRDVRGRRRTGTTGTSSSRRRPADGDGCWKAAPAGRPCWTRDVAAGRVHRAQLGGPRRRRGPGPAGGRQDRHPAVGQHQGQPGRVDGRVHAGTGDRGVVRQGEARADPGLGRQADRGRHRPGEAVARLRAHHAERPAEAPLPKPAHGRAHRRRRRGPGPHRRSLRPAARWRRRSSTPRARASGWR